MELNWKRLKTTFFVNMYDMIVKIESTGILPPQDIFLRALDILDDKAKCYSI